MKSLGDESRRFLVKYGDESKTNRDLIFKKILRAGKLLLKKFNSMTITIMIKLHTILKHTHEYYE